MGSSIIVETTKPPSACNTRRLLTTTHRSSGKGAELILPTNGNRFSDRDTLIWNSGLDAESKLILLFLSQAQDASPSMEAIGECTSLGRRTVLRRVQALESSGILTVSRRLTQGLKASSQYAIDWDVLSAAPSVQCTQPIDHSYQEHRDFVFSRDGNQCVYCGSTARLSLDHVIPQSKGGAHTPDNLVTACKSCNCAKRDKSLSEWLGGAL
jgi:biotin operon repressor